MTTDLSGRGQYESKPEELDPITNMRNQLQYYLIHAEHLRKMIEYLETHPDALEFAKMFAGS